MPKVSKKLALADLQGKSLPLRLFTPFFSTSLFFIFLPISVRILILRQRTIRDLEFMTQYPWSTRVIPTSYLLPVQWPQPQNDELLLAMEEAEYEEKCNEIRKINSNLTIIGKTSVDNDKEEFDNDADDDDADNADESEGCDHM
ncbi:hypothetical protein ACS0TY_025107 [Phlomoides rotata]